MPTIQGNLTPEGQVEGTVYASDVSSGGGGSNAEVIDARTGYNGSVFKSLGEAIRTQITNLWNAVNGKQPAGNYLTEVPDGYATKDFVTNKIAEAELSGGGDDIDLSGFAEKSDIPKKVSQLENDAGYLTEHQDITGKLDANKLPEAINTALAQAKASGEFDGADGKDGINGKDGYTPVKGVDYFDGINGKDGEDGKDGTTVRNLLINSDFSNPVMSRGLNCFCGINKYVVDKWISWDADAVQGNGYITPQSPIDQNIDPKIIDLSKIYTVAIGLADGSVICYRGKSANGIGLFSTVYFGFRESGTPFVRIGTGHNVVWVALYEGEYTDETLPKYQPKGYETELLICRQYDGDEYIGLRKFSQPRNLLDNSDFTNLIAQGGLLCTRGDKLYLADRWYIDTESIQYDANTRKFTFNGTSPAIFGQKILNSLEGKKVTLAVKARNVNGNVHLSENIPTDDPNHKDQAIAEGITVRTFTVTIPNLIIVLWGNNGSSAVFDWIALYEGEYTAETLPEYQPKGYGVELIECMRYYQRMFVRFAGRPKSVNLPIPMMCIPHIYYEGGSVNSEVYQMVDNKTMDVTSESSYTAGYFEFDTLM